VAGIIRQTQPRPLVYIVARLNADSALPASAARLHLGSSGYFPPRHRMPINSRNEGTMGSFRYHFPRRALTLCPQLCAGIQHGARFPARIADALPATLYEHFTQATY
jgi:hypothetical protein